MTIRNARTSEEMIEPEEEIPEPTPQQLKEVVTGARRIVEAENDIAKIETTLAEKRDALKVLQEKILPEAMSRAGIATMELSKGWTLRLNELVTAAIPTGKKKGGEDLREPAFARLEETGAGGLIKHTITISFPKNEEKWARKFLKDLSQRKRPLPFVRDDTVHGQTLSAHVRQLLINGELTDEDRRLFGVYEIKKAVVDRPKESTDLGK